MSKKNINIKIFCIGATGYSAIEILWRGFTHWTMALTGGVCFLSLYHIFSRFSFIARWKKCVIGCGVITMIEFIVGCIVNMYLKWRVWDYSDHAFHIYGQICFFYSLMWFILSAPISVLVDYIRSKSV